MAGSTGPFGRLTGEAVAVAVATCPGALAASIISVAPANDTGSEGASPEGLGGAKEKLDADGKAEEVEERALKEKREDVVEGRAKE